jgi:hypothetical protein
MQRDGATIHRLDITPVGSLQTGACGRYRKRWDFTLSSPASAAGYIVQKVDFHRLVEDCSEAGACPATPELTFWEAWPVLAGATQHRLRSSSTFTDQSSFGGNASKVGCVIAAGEVKFYLRSVTGDLGDFNTAPATPNGGWGPNASGQSGSLPSTLTEPTWWGTAPTEGSPHRDATAGWRCCGDSGDFNTIHASP